MSQLCKRHSFKNTETNILKLQANQQIVQFIFHHLITFIAATETTTQFENSAIVVGLDDGTMTTNDVFKINLHRPNEISTQEQIPTTKLREAFAAVYCNTMYVIGVGDNKDEICKYKQISGWLKCSSLVQ